MEKIIIFSSHRTIESGGVGTHLRHLINEVKRSGVNSDILLGLPTKKMIKIKFLQKFLQFFYNSEQAQIIYYNTYILELKNELQKLLLKSNEKEIVIHCHEKFTAIASYLCKNDNETKDIKIIQTLHAPFSDHFKMTQPNSKELFSYYRLLDIGMTMEINSLIGVDKLQVEIAENLMVKDSEQFITNISNAVDAEQLDKLGADNIIFNTYGINNYFVIARHLLPKNGVIYGIMAFKEFLKSNKNFSLIVMGDGQERENIQKYISNNNLKDFVKLIGSKPHLESLNIIKQSYASIIPSIPMGLYIEATSLSMLESMYLGIPVLASRIGGLAEVISDRKNGLLFEPKNISEIVKVMNEIVENKELYKIISFNSNLTVKTDFVSSVWFEKVMKVYNN